MCAKRSVESGAREQQGLSNPHAHDTALAIRVAVEAVRLLIEQE